MIDKVPPHNLEAEINVLGAILLDCEHGLPIAIEILKPENFYREAHRQIFVTLVRMFAKDKPVDMLTVRDALIKQNLLESIGGPVYLSTLVNSVATARNIGYHAEIVRDLFSRRELINLGITLNDCYDQSVDVTEQINFAEKKLLDITAGKLDKGFIPVGDVVDVSYEQYEQVVDGHVVSQGIPYGFKELDKMTLGMNKGDMNIIAARPGMGKTALALQIAINIGMKLNKPVGIFSLEMSRQQLTDRLICSEAQYNFKRRFEKEYMVGKYDDFTNAVEAVRNSKIFIDDTCGVNVLEIKAKAKRLKSKHGLEVLFIDYLQLMAGNSKKGRNREQEVADMSRGVKLIARDLDISVFLLCQLSRSCEARQDKMPQLNDLRECLSESTTLIWGDKSVQWNCHSQQSVLSLNSGSLESRPSTNIPKMRNKVKRYLMSSGRFVDCTDDHPILTDRGWVKAKDLTRDYAIASIRKIDEPIGTETIPHAKWIGWMLGNGCSYGYNVPSFICSDKAVAEEFLSKTEELFGFKPKPHAHRCKSVFQYDITKHSVRVSGGNPVTNWLKENDLWGRKSYQKYIPEWFINQADNSSISELLAGLFETDGSVAEMKTGRSVISYSTTSNFMAFQILWCLNRLNVFARIDQGYMSPKANHPCYKITIEGREMKRFHRQVVLVGVKGNKLNRSIKPNYKESNYGDKLSRFISKEIMGELKNHRSHSELGYRYQNKRVSKTRLEYVLFRYEGMLKTLSFANQEKAKALLDKYRWLTSEYLYWDRLKEVQVLSDKPVDVIDRSVPGTHNFVANGIVVHNSGAIEQDADAVFFIYRPSYYDRKLQDDTKAMIHVAKQRSGPTGVVELEFVPEYTLFRDKQPFISKDYHDLDSE